MATTSGAGGAGAASDGAAAASSSSSSRTSNNEPASRAPPSPYSSEQSDAESDDERSATDGFAAQQQQQPPPSLPSISSAALMQLRSSGGGARSSSQATPVADDEDDDSEGDDDDDDPRRDGRRRRRSRSRSRERPPTAAPAPESDGDERELRVVFHGREVWADDLVGLRVAKSFAGVGRFLGQVVRFDEPTARFTVVYADGDAEELSVDHTIEILIQDEIERADPALPPVAVAAYGESPEKSDAKVPPVSATQQRPETRASHSGAEPAAGPRLAVQISEREAQFVLGLFENHALPVLLRDGWKVQVSASGSEHRYYSPPGNFPGAGRVFISALAVVELIASDERTLSACFPQNVRAGIQSLFVDASRKSDGTRKRVPAPSADDEAFDPKRPRAAGRESSAGGPPSSHTRPLSAHHSAPPSSSLSSSSQRYSGAGDYRSYRSEDASMDRERDAYPAERMQLGDQYGDVPSSSLRASEHSGLRSYHHDAGEFRGPGSGPMHGPPANAPVSRWPSTYSIHASPGPPSSSSLEADEYRRSYADSPGWGERETPLRGGGPHASVPPPLQYHHDGYRGSSRPEEVYYADQRAPRSSARVGPGGEIPPGSYRYQDVRNSPNRGSPRAEQFHRQVSSGRVAAHPSLDTQSHVCRDAEFRMGGGPARDGMVPGRDTFMLSNASRRGEAPPAADHPPPSQQQLMRAASEQAKWGSHRSPPERVGFEPGDLGQSVHGGGHHRRHHQPQQQQQHQQHVPLQQPQQMPSKADS